MNHKFIIMIMIFLITAVGCYIGYVVNVSNNTKFESDVCVVNKYEIKVSSCSESCYCYQGKCKTCHYTCYILKLYLENGCIDDDDVCKKGDVYATGYQRNFGNLVQYADVAYPINSMIECLVSLDPDNTGKYYFLLREYPTTDVFISSMVFFGLFGLSLLMFLVYHLCCKEGNTETAETVVEKPQDIEEKITTI